MRFNVSHLVKAPIGARDVVHLSVGTVTLSADLVLHYLHGDIAFTRTSNGLLAEGRLVTELDCECVRCLTTVPLSFTFQLEDLIFALPQAPSRVSEYRITEHGWVDTTQALREQILLTIPLSILCRPDCRGLCIQCGQDLNVGTCGCEDQMIDPRLMKLRDLLQQ